MSALLFEDRICLSSLTSTHCGRRAMTTTDERSVIRCLSLSIAIELSSPGRRIKPSAHPPCAPDLSCSQTSAQPQAGDAQREVDADLTLQGDRLQRYRSVRAANQHFGPGTHAERGISARAHIVSSERAMMNP
jgi:hypothetical protein